MVEQTTFCRISQKGDGMASDRDQVRATVTSLATKHAQLSRAISSGAANQVALVAQMLAEMINALALLEVMTD